MKKVKLIDGEIGTQILKYDKEVEGDPLWCSRFNQTNPDAVYQCYMDFLRAGSELIRTNTYQASVEGFKKYLQLDNSDCQKLFHDIVQVARKARMDFIAETGTTRPIEVWTSVGSYGAFLSDGSEYTGAFVDTVSIQTIRQFHLERLNLLLDNDPDGVAVETIPSLVEAKIVVDLFNEYYPTVKYWVSFQCKDERTTAKGESFKDVAEAIWNQARNSSLLVGIGVNCVDPKLIAPLFELLDNKNRSDDAIPLVAYPNSGERFDLEKRQWVDVQDRKPLSHFLPQWVELGLTTVGGCCRNTSCEISELRQYLDRSN